MTVVESPAAQHGIVGCAVRWEVPGEKLWTMTVWEDDASREAYVRSPVHLAAIQAGKDSMRQGRFAWVEIPTAQRRLSWPEALAVLDSEAARY
ncbi:MAG: hypothetical protein NTY94_14690 [Alphaproteobacteria bacterium]|jgi:hypothetical protein|nr:hypothetical protein [Alphaproteobacteria bacterium]